MKDKCYDKKMVDNIHFFPKETLEQSLDLTHDNELGNLEVIVMNKDGQTD